MKQSGGVRANAVCACIYWNQRLFKLQNWPLECTQKIIIIHWPATGAHGEIFLFKNEFQWAQFFSLPSYTMRMNLPKKTHALHLIAFRIARIYQIEPFQFHFFTFLYTFSIIKFISFNLDSAFSQFSQCRWSIVQVSGVNCWLHISLHFAFRE